MIEKLQQEIAILQEQRELAVVQLERRLVYERTSMHLGHNAAAAALRIAEFDAQLHQTRRMLQAMPA